MEKPHYTLYGTNVRRRRWPYLIALAVAVLAALGVWQFLAMPRVIGFEPERGTFLSTARPTVALDIHGLGGLKDVKVSLDGADVTQLARMDGDRLSLAVAELDDGEHSVSFAASSSSIFRSTISEAWRFTVDTTTPTLELDAALKDGQVNTSPATFTGVTEPLADVVANGDGMSGSATADAQGAFTVSAPLPDGPSKVTLTATDRAGNAVAQTLSVYVDAVAPTLTVSELGKTRSSAALKVKIVATDQIGEPKVKVLLDDEAQSITGTAKSKLLKATDLAQGRHTLVVTASDKGGNVTTSKQTFVVDSSEQFGSEALWPGARGKDVKDLQKRLADFGLFSGTRNGVYDARTEAAVKEYQESHGMGVDGRVAGDTLTALGGQIVVDLGDLRLYLYQGNKVYKSYGIAVGQAAYPTPTGSFYIVNMQQNPTWVPPDSEWAKGAEPIPPGPNNPLGTRWIGINYSGVGIHGTPDDSSIGTYASHGCIRMHIADVEDLYDRVVVGMPVTIRL
ncbi:MAG: L,D-transpeptidase family protein [Thermoleophilia bacterium]